MIAQPLAGVEIGASRSKLRELHQGVKRNAVEVGGRLCTVLASDSLAAFAEHWPLSDRPDGAACHVFQCADLLEVWLDTVGAARRTRPVFVGLFDEAGRPMLLLALGIESKRGGR